MKKGNIAEINIEDMSGEGQGIGKTAEGFVVFVPGTVPGDTVSAELTKVKKNYGFARLIDIKTESSDRTNEFDCEFFENGCGGCQYGRLRYEAQLALKEKQVRSRLERIGGIESPLVRTIIGMQEADNEGSGPYRYRNKAQFPVSTGGIITRKGGIVENLGTPAVGFFRAKSHEVVDCGDCYLQSLPAMAAADALRRFMDEDHITAWDPKWKKGLIRHLIVKTGFYTGEVMVVIVINGNGIPNTQKLVEMLDDAIYDVGYSLESVVLNIKKADSDTAAKGKAGAGPDIMGDKNVVAAGAPVITDKVGNLSFEISPSSFYQVNPVQMKRLYDKVREYCGFAPECSAEIPDADNHDAYMPETGRFRADKSNADKSDADKPVVLDIYCGIGTIGLYCADAARAVVGIESVKEAVIDANRNAVINNIVNARYICGRAEEILPEYIKAAELKVSEDNSAAAVNGAAAKDNTPGGDASGGDAAPGQFAVSVDPELADLIKSADIAILDPPRAGCRPELLEAVAETGAERIIYISCDPATLARDIKLLGELGYNFIEATPVDMFPWTVHVETVCLLSQQKPDDIIRIGLDLSELDITASEKKATYEEIQSYVLEHTGLKVNHLYIAQVKQKYGIIERENCNKPKSEDSKQPQCPPEKEAAITEALTYFKMI